MNYLLTIFDETGDILDQNVYSKISDIAKDYSVPYHQLYYILQYNNGENKHKPGKKMRELMDSISIESVPTRVQRVTTNESVPTRVRQVTAKAI